MHRHSPKVRSGISLLEIVLALGLSGMLLYAVGLAMDLHFRALDVQRTRVERTQVARTVLRHMSDDVRSAMQQMPVDLEGLKEAAKNQKAARSMVMTNATGQTPGATNTNGNNNGNNGPGGNNNNGQQGQPGQTGGPPPGAPGAGGPPPGQGTPPGLPPGGIPGLPPGFDPSMIPAGALPPGVTLPPGLNANNLGALAGSLPGANANAGGQSGQGSGAGGAGGSAGGGRGGAGGGAGAAGGAFGAGAGGQAGSGAGRGGQGGAPGQGGPGQGGGQGQPGGNGGRGGGAGGGQSPGNNAGSSKGGSSSGGAAAGANGAAGAAGSASTGGSMQLNGQPAADDEEATEPATIVGLFGSATQLQFDISRLPRLDQYASADGQVPSDIQTVIYYLGSLATGSTGVADPSAAVTGLMRVQRERAATSFAESSGDSASNFAGGKMIASEVAALQFRYFSGEEWLDAWDSDEQGGLPLAVEAEILMADPTLADSPSFLGNTTQAKSAPAQTFRMVIPIPVAKPGANLPPETTEEEESSSSSSGSTSSSSKSGSK